MIPWQEAPTRDIGVKCPTCRRHHPECNEPASCFYGPLVDTRKVIDLRSAGPMMPQPSRVEGGRRRSIDPQDWWVRSHILALEAAVERASALVWP